MIAVLLHEHILPNCHSEERSDEESLGSGVQILRFTQNDSITETFGLSRSPSRVIPTLGCLAALLESVGIQQTGPKRGG